MTNGKVSACLYISRRVLETAKEAGLNLSKVSENALIEAIGRLEGTARGMVSSARYTNQIIVSHDKR